MLGKLTAATEEQKSSLTPVVRALDLHFPEQMDAAVNQLLQHSQQGEQAAKAVFKTLQKALAGSSHAPLLSSGSTLALAIDAPSAELRIAVGSTVSYGFKQLPCTPCYGLLVVHGINGVLAVLWYLILC